MERDEARALKHEVAQYVVELLAARAQAAAAPPQVHAQVPPRVGVAFGLVPRAEGQFDVAVRYRLGTPTARMVVRRVCDQAGPQADVRRTGRIRPLSPARIRPPTPTAQATGLTGRVRPLRPGISIAHYAVTAGTLGAFVTRAAPASGGDPGDRGRQAVHVLSNWHVLAGSPSAQVGDVVLQPGSADGGRAPEDRVGELAVTVPLAPGRTSTVDAALARLDDPQVDPAYPVGRLAGAGVVEGDELVQKVGRTTGVTDGRISAIELDEVLVGYGDPLGDLRFDNQIEVESTGAGPFSRGGDSGSLVYRPRDRVAVGLLFAGSETGGQNGTGLTYVNPIGEVLAAVGATLL